MWLQACAAYVEQLARSNDPHGAVSYLLMCDKVDAAVEVYLASELHVDALALAKSRCLPSDPLIARVYAAWAEACEVHSRYEQAAKW